MNLFLILFLFWLIVLAEDAIKAALKDYRVKNEKNAEAIAGKWIYFFSLMSLQQQQQMGCDQIFDKN